MPIHAIAERMLKPWQYRCLLIFGALAVVLVFVNAGLVLSNRAQQVEINQRQMFLQQTATLDTLYREMVKALADLALRNGDNRVLETLSSLGITVTVNPPSAVASDASGKK